MQVYEIMEPGTFVFQYICHPVGPPCPYTAPFPVMQYVSNEMLWSPPDSSYTPPTCKDGPPSAFCLPKNDDCVAGTSAIGCSPNINIKNLGPPDVPNACLSNPSAGNPVDIATGNKYQVETDYKVATSPLSFERFYNAGFSVKNTQIGTNWRHTYQRSISLFEKNNQVVAELLRHDGKVLYFTYSSGKFNSDNDRTDKLDVILDGSGKTIGYTYYSALDDETETYDLAGKLKLIKTRSGVTLHLAYDGYNHLSTVTDSFGHHLIFSWDNNIRTVTDPAGNVYRYDYDPDNKKLVAITYPDNTVRRYLYEDTTHPYALTGIIDENGARYATWSYDTLGRAVSSQHAGGAESTTLAFNTGSVAVTDALGTQRTYATTEIQGSKKISSSSQPAGAGCAAAASALTYDTNGNLSSKTDFNGNKTAFTYDTIRNLETKRVEIPGTARSLTTTTEWHPTFRLATRIAQPRKMIVNSYDSNGNLLSTSEQATSDANGAQGFGAVPTGTARVWTYTYNQYGQVLSEKGPRSDVDTTTRYAYDAQGNMTSITNALGQVTSFDNYDANGRPGRSVDPNGLVTTFAYSPRGWVTDKTVGTQNTHYEYDGVGQLIRAQQPDGSAQRYTYDDAHRLTGITDNLGNRIAYTLDAMGNRVNEQVRDVNGGLTRQINRSYDPLNRLKQITGAAR